MSSLKGRNASCFGAGSNAGDQEFRYGIAKFLQRLQRFCNGSENFAILAKFRYGQIFRYDSEISLS